MDMASFLGHIPRYSHDEISRALAEDDRDVLLFAGISAAYHDPDWSYAQDLCIKLYENPNKTVRGNAILGLVMIAKNRGTLNPVAIEPILLRALKDPEGEVRIRAKDAIREINTILNWDIAKDKLHLQNPE
jgi:HEAT repeat protein